MASRRQHVAIPPSPSHARPRHCAAPRRRGQRDGVWDADVDALRLLFTHETTERWNVDGTGAVYGSPGIDENRRWRDSSDAPSLIVTFDRVKFGGPDTWHTGMEDVNLPFFEPIDS